MNRPRWLPRFPWSRQACPECGASVHETYCETCGYDLIEKTRADTAVRRPPV